MSAAPNDPGRKLRVFLCHAHADRVAVRELYRRLKEQGVEPWLDDEALLAGQLWQQEIPKAVSKSDVVIVCLSEEFTRAGYRQKEVKLALEVFEQQQPGAIFLIPARLENCAPYEPLNSFHRVDLFTEGGPERLLLALRQRARDLGICLEAPAPPKRPELRRARSELQQRIQRFVQDLRSPESNDWSYAAQELCRLGPAAKSAVPYLILHLQDDDPDVRSATAGVLASIGPEAKDAVPVLTQTLQENNLRVCTTSAAALGRIGPAAMSSVPALVQKLQHESSSVRLTVVEALGRIGPSAASAVPALTRALEDDHHQVPPAAQEALAAITAQPTEVAAKTPDPIAENLKNALAREREDQAAATSEQLLRAEFETLAQREAPHEFDQLAGLLRSRAEAITAQKPPEFPEFHYLEPNHLLEAGKFAVELQCRADPKEYLVTVRVSLHPNAAQFTEPEVLMKTIVKPVRRSGVPFDWEVRAAADENGFFWADTGTNERRSPDEIIGAALNTLVQLLTTDLKRALTNQRPESP